LTQCNKLVINPGYVPRKRRTTQMKIDYRTPAEFGYLVGVTDRAYARLAFMAADLASRGQIDVSDAEDVLESFNRARSEARGWPVLESSSGKQQVSKMRKVIECGATFHQAGVDMLELAARLFLHEKYTKGSDKLPAGEYNAVVEVARRAVANNKLLTEKDITKLLTGKL
jgi:hypothetical protein